MLARAGNLKGFPVFFRLGDNHLRVGDIQVT